MGVSHSRLIVIYVCRFCSNDEQTANFREKNQ